MAANAHPPPPEVIDLLGSTDDEDEDEPLIVNMRAGTPPVQIESDDEDAADDALLQMAGAFPGDEPVDPVPPPLPGRERHTNGGMIVVVDGEEVFIPDEEPQVAPKAEATSPMSGLATNLDRTPIPENRDFTADDCLQHVLEIFPDISHDHVRSLYAGFDAAGDYQALGGRARLDNIVEQLVSATSYPKQESGKLKRKREESIDSLLNKNKWDGADRGPVPPHAKGAIAAICKAEFPTIPRNHINDRQDAHGHLFATYVTLSKDMDDKDEGAPIFGRGRATKAVIADANSIAKSCGQAYMWDELNAARTRVAAIKSQREAAKVKKLAEEENLQKAIAAGETAECSACFDDLPMNRQIHCNGDSAHFTCFECAEMYIKTEVGDARCKVVCPSGCGAGFAHNQLHLLEDKQLLEKLAQIQQEQDIRDAGLDDLEECPFCDFKAIMPPIDEDFEFRCANPECERVSCRRCKAVSHIPISCEQYAKDNKLSSRHQIEEAMTAALVRSCNKCKKHFIKESGCNKMSCMSCGSLQCYVCSATVTDYNHFDQGPPRGRRLDGNADSKKCPLYDNVEERHEREVKEAEAKARAEIVESNPDVTAEDLEIKVSDAVKKAESDRVRRAGGGGVFGGFGIPIGGRGRAFVDEMFGGDFPAFDDDEEGGMEDLLAAAMGPPRGPRRNIELNRIRAEARAHARERRDQYVAAAANRERDLFVGNAQQAVGGAQAARDERRRRDNDFDDLFGPFPNAAPQLRGYIPVLLEEGQRHGQRMQQRPWQQERPPQQDGFGWRAGMGNYGGLFGRLFHGGNDVVAHPPAQPQPRVPAPAFMPNNPANNGRQSDNDNNPATGANNAPLNRPQPPHPRPLPNDYMPGAWPHPYHPPAAYDFAAAYNPQLNMANAQDPRADVLDRQRHEIARAQNERLRQRMVDYRAQQRRAADLEGQVQGERQGRPY